MKSAAINYEEEVGKCKTIEDVMGKNGLIKRLMKNTIETMLKAELEEHLGYKKYEIKGKNSGNSRNGNYTKNVRSEVGKIELEIPRDRRGKFEPQIVKKHAKGINEFDEKIISMYSKGMTTRDIQCHVRDIYGADISPTMVSMITDKIVTLATDWQKRPLEKIYPIVYFDAIFYKVRNGFHVEDRASYTCFGIGLNGKKDILGSWLKKTEGAKNWKKIFKDIKLRGVEDIFIACVDGLKGLPEALEAVFPKANVQLCIVHMIRNSLKYVGKKNMKKFIIDLKPVYKAASEQEAKMALERLNEKWGENYPLAVNPWINNWKRASHYFRYQPELRKIIYTTNAIEGLHRQFRKVTKNRSVMPNDDSLLKLIFLAGRDIRKKWIKPVANWSLILTQLSVFFEERIIAN